MMKIASLVAAAGMASAWDLSLSSNNTWIGNDDQPAGGIFTFTNDGGDWSNSTGVCTVSAAGSLSFLSGFDLFTLPNAGGDDYQFVDAAEGARSSISFLVNTDLNGDAPAEDFLSVSCDNSDVSGPMFRSFPSHPQEPSLRGSIRGAQGSNFVMSFPAGVNVVNMTFDDAAVIIGEEVNGAYSVDATAANSDEIWFGADWQDDSRIGGSWALDVQTQE